MDAFSMKKYCLFLVIVMSGSFHVLLGMVGILKSNYLEASNGESTFLMKVPDKPWIEVNFPFSSNHPVQCSQANASPAGRSHYYTNTLFAVDLHSLPGAAAGKIYAVFGGKAFIEDGCNCAESNEPGVSNACRCNGGFGNNVRIAKNDGTYALYAHLSEIVIQHGEEVKSGQCIGIEGASGAAGHRHLHFSVHKTADIQDLMRYQTPGLSIPFVWFIRYNQEKEANKINSLDMVADQKIIYGTTKL